MPIFKKNGVAKRLLGLTLAISIGSLGIMTNAKEYQLSTDLTSLNIQLSDTTDKIESLADDVEKAKLDLEAAKLNEEMQYDSMKERIKFMYEGGSSSLLQILFSSENMSDFLNKAEYVNMITDYDREMLEDFMEATENVEAKKADLEAQQKEMEELKEAISDQISAMEKKIAAAKAAEKAQYEETLKKAKSATSDADSALGNESQTVKQSENSTKKSDDSSSSSSTSDDDSSGSGTTQEQPTQSSVSDLTLLAAVLDLEAAGYEGKLAVATVVMNRVASGSFPNTISGVIYQKNQFYASTNSRLLNKLASGPSALSYQVAGDAIAGKRLEAVAGCYSYRAAWATTKEGVNVAGNVFF